MSGANWSKLPNGEAPRAVMAPDNGADDGWDVDAFVQHHILDLKFNAVHRPLQGLRPSHRDHRLCELAEEYGFLVIFWMYGDAQAGTAPEDSLGFEHNKRHQESVMRDLASYTQFVMGLGYDNREWVSDNEGNRWYKRSKEFVSHVGYGIRARLDEDRRHPNGPSILKGYRPGDYASFEVRLTDNSTLSDMLLAADTPTVPGQPPVSRPVINEERMRLGGRDKDVKSMLALLELIREYRKANVGNVYGVRDAEVNWRWPSNWHDSLRAANIGDSATQAPNTVPELSEITILEPGTAGVLSWLIVDEQQMVAEVMRGQIHLFYGPLDWPAFTVVSDERKHIGTVWMIYWESNGRWVAYPSEHLAADNNEFRSTFFGIAKIPFASLQEGSPVGFFIAGPSRHAADWQGFHRRTKIHWFRWGDGLLTRMTPEQPGPEGPEEQEGDDMKVLNIQELQSFRVTARPGGDGGTKWNEHRHWPTEERTISVQKVNDTDNTYILYAVSMFLGMEANKQDELTAEPRVRTAEGHGRLLPAHVAEKDEPGGAFDASRVVMLPLGIRMPPGSVFEGKFTHTNTGTGGQNPDFANVPHGVITFFCYKEE